MSKGEAASVSLLPFSVGHKSHKSPPISWRPQFPTEKLKSYFKKDMRDRSLFCGRAEKQSLIPSEFLTWCFAKVSAQSMSVK